MCNRVASLPIASPIYDTVICSKFPDNFGTKPFCISCSTKLLERRNAKIEFLRADINVLIGTDANVIGRKLAGAVVSPLK